MTFYLYADEVLDRVASRLSLAGPNSPQARSIISHLYANYDRYRQAVYARLPPWALTETEWLNKMSESGPYGEPEENKKEYETLLERSYRADRPIPRIVKVRCSKLPLSPHDLTHWEFKKMYPDSPILAWEISVLEAQLSDVPLHPDVARSWQVFQAQKALAPDTTSLERLPFLAQSIALYAQNEQEGGWMIGESKDIIQEHMLAAYDHASEGRRTPLTGDEIGKLILKERQTILELSGLLPYQLSDVFDYGDLLRKLTKRNKGTEVKNREDMRKQVSRQYPQYPDVLRQMKEARAQWMAGTKPIEWGTHRITARIGTKEYQHAANYTKLGTEAQRMEKAALGHILTHILSNVR